MVMDMKKALSKDNRKKPLRNPANSELLFSAHGHTNTHIPLQLSAAERGHNSIVASLQQGESELATVGLCEIRPSVLSCETGG